MEKYYYISGYWKDSLEKFEDYIVKNTEQKEGQEINDDDIFYYNLTEKNIQHILKFQDEENNFEFIITSYKNTSL